MHRSESTSKFRRHLAVAVGAVLASAASLAAEPPVRGGDASDAAEVAPADRAETGTDEIVVTGRLLNAAEALTEERIELPFSADFLGTETMARAGDSNIAGALRRVPGLTLIDGKFVYVRGLGERYSTVLFNGAAVPSPDLTRSVMPLDMFPTSIVESIKIQKSPSPDQPANFGGGAIDIRTRAIPDARLAQLSVGVGWNSEGGGDGLSYGGGSTDMPEELRNAINTYRGDISVSNILSTLRLGDSTATVEQARTIHQGLLNSLDRRVGIRSKSLDPDMDAKLALGNTWDINSDWTFGALLNGAYNRSFRNENQHREGVGSPINNYLDTTKTVEETREIGALNLGLRYLGEHSLEVSTYLLRNDEDEAAISQGYDANYQFPNQKMAYSTRLEQRELRVTQVTGEHAFEDTPYLSGLLDRMRLGGLTFDWLYSDSQVTTDIPNETEFQASAMVDTAGVPLTTQILGTTSSGIFSFLKLEDEQSSWAGNFHLPLMSGSTELALSSGWWGMKKSREYYGYNINLNAVGVASQYLSGDPGSVLNSDGFLVDNGFNLSLGTNLGTESYVAAQKVNAGYAMFDLNFDETWRLTAGARYETYQQAALPIDLLDYTGASIRNLQNQLASPSQTLAIQEDDIYPSAALTYIGSGLLGTGEYQVRLSYGATVVRPDLREVADVVYIDPELDVRVQGNPGLRSSDIDNFELRSEFYYDSGDNFTVSLFYKDITAPIEVRRDAGSDDDFVLGFANAVSGELYGVEFEGLKQLPWGLFLQGNVTLSDSKLTIDPTQTNTTNLERPLTGHSKYVVNTTLGYDANNQRHSAYLSYNIFGERVFFAGTGQNDDAYEKPFNSLGLVYNYYPLDGLEISLKVDNILDEAREFEQKNFSGATARIISQDVGTTVGLSAKWTF